jgi:hypothetical protein
MNPASLGNNRIPRDISSITEITSISQTNTAVGVPKITQDSPLETLVDNSITSELHGLKTMQGLILENSVSSSVIDFLARPQLIQTFNSLSSTFTPSVFNPFTLFMQLAVVKNKWANYAFGRGTICVRASITTTPYAYGFIMFSYEYNASKRTAVASAADYPWSNYQRNATILDVGSSGSVVFKIPYSSSVPYWDLTGVLNNVNVLPIVSAGLLTPITNYQDGTVPPYNISIYCWMEDMELVVPTPVAPQSEISQRVISSTLSAFSTATAALSNVPFIGPFATAFSTATAMGASVATLFGFSRPHDDDPHTTVGFNPSALSIIPDQFRKLTFDPHQSVTIDPKIFSDPSDNLSFASILGRYGITQITSLNQTMALNSVVTVQPVAPGAQAFSLTNGVQMSPVIFGSLLFSGWRGSLVYRFQFAASKYHRCRMRLSWSPTTITTYSDTTVSMTAYSLLFDLAATTEVEITVPWNHHHPYLPVKLQPILNFTPLVDCNGTLYLTIVDPLIAQAASAPISVIVSVRAGDDFELVNPNSKMINSFNRNPYVAPNGRIYQASTSDIVLPTGGATTGYVAPTAVCVVGESLITNDTDASQIAKYLATFGSSTYMEAPSKIYNGERFNSFRPLCKRFVTAGFAQVLSSIDTFSEVTVPYLPLEPSTGRQPAAVTFNTDTMWIPFHWLSTAFRGSRGGVRVNVTPLMNGGDPVSYSMDLHVLRKDGLYNQANENLVSNGTTFFTETQQLTAEQYTVDSFRGAEKFSCRVGQQCSFEIPWLYPFGFIASYLPFYFVDSPFTTPFPAVRVQTHMVNSIGADSQMTFELEYAIGEDFSLVHWEGVPFFYGVNPSAYN